MSDTETKNGSTTAVMLPQPEAMQKIFAGAPDAIAKNSDSTKKCIAAGTLLLKKVTDTGGMNDALDADINNFLVKARITSENIEERRKPITQIFDMIKKQFTELENSISAKNDKSIYAQLQTLRNNWAAKKAAEQKKKDDELKRQLAVEKEKVAVTAEVERQLSKFFRDYVDSRLNILNEYYKELALENWEVMKQAIATFKVSYPYENFQEWTPVRSTIPRVYMNDEELLNVILNVKTGKFEDFRSDFNVSAITLRDDLLDKIPGRIEELKVIAKSKDEAEKKRMEEAARQRQVLEDERLRSEAEKKRLAAEQQIENKKIAGTTEAIFNATAPVISSDAPAAQVREGYEIEVTHQMGYLLLVQFYFERDGKSEEVEKLEKKTLGSMKKFAEAAAMKEDIKIQSPFLVYKEKFTAVAIKSK